MQTNHTKTLIAFGAAVTDDPIAAAIKAATEGEFVSGRFLKQELEAAGYSIVETPRNVLTRVEIMDGEGDAATQIAYGESNDAGDALLHAVLGYVREYKPKEDQAATARG